MDVIVQHHHVHRGPSLAIAARCLKAMRIPFPPMEDLDVGTVEAVVNHGRWVVECPLGCGGAMLADVDEPVFICPNCGSGGRYHDVVFPARRRSVEAELLKRPGKSPSGAATRNWRSGETVEDLRAENVARGIE